MLALATSLGCGHGPLSDAGTGLGLPIEFNLSEGQSIGFSQLGLRVEATKVSDFTSEGCLGGPIGCPDSIQLSITRDAQSAGQQVTLQVAHTGDQDARGINQADAFEYRITLMGMQNAVATLLIDTR